MKSMDHAKKVVLGTVQIGLDYGVSNRSGLMPLTEATDLIKTAHRLGCRTLDTAQAYGDAELKLGQIGVDQFKVISKLAHLPQECSDLTEHVYRNVHEMRSKVGTRAFEAVLLHNPRELLVLTDKQISQVTAGFDLLKREGVIRKCGVSVYNPNELEDISSCFDSELVQIPCCPLDARWAELPRIQKMFKSGVEIHVRSIFLQGLLLMKSADIPGYFNPWSEMLGQWREWVKDHGMTRLEACLLISLKNPLFDKIVVGAQSKDELEQQFHCLSNQMLDFPTIGFGTSDEAFLDPSRWGK